MIVAVLLLALAGSFAGAILAWLQDATLWQIALAYVGGGWAGLLGGLPVAMALRGLARLLRAGPARPGAPRKAGFRHAVVKSQGHNR